MVGDSIIERKWAHVEGRPESTVLASGAASAAAAAADISMFSMAQINRRHSGHSD